MHPEIAKGILEFMKRVDLKGAEVPAFSMCIQALSQEINPTPPPVVPDQPAGGVKAPIDLES